MKIPIEIPISITTKDGKVYKRVLCRRVLDDNELCNGWNFKLFETQEGDYMPFCTRCGDTSALTWRKEVE